MGRPNGPPFPTCVVTTLVPIANGIVHEDSMAASDSSESVVVEELIRIRLDKAARNQKDLRSSDDIYRFISEQLGQVGEQFLETLSFRKLQELREEYRRDCNVYRSDQPGYALTGDDQQPQAGSPFGIRPIDGDSGYGDHEAANPRLSADRSRKSPYPYFSEETAFDVHLVPDPDKQETSIRTARYNETSPDSYIDEEEARGLCQVPVERGQIMRVHWRINYQDVGMRSGYTDCKVVEELEDVNIVFGTAYNSRESEPVPGPGVHAESTCDELDKETETHRHVVGMAQVLAEKTFRACVKRHDELEKETHRHMVGMAQVLAEKTFRACVKRRCGGSNEDPRRKQKT